MARIDASSVGASTRHRSRWGPSATRLFYIVPTQAVDLMLTLNIEPRPEKIARVFVGRLEIVSPELLHEVSAQ